MGFPRIVTRLFANAGAGPKLRRSIMPGLMWDPEETYDEPTWCRGSNGKIYMWNAPSGLGVSDVGPKDPVSAASAEYWVDFVEGNVPALSDAVDSTASNVAASSKAVKTAYDMGVDAFYPVSGTATKSGSTLTLDLSTGLIFNHTFVGATTIQFSNQPLNRNALIVLKMVNAGNYAITWPATIKWPSGAAPKLTANGSDEVNILFQYNGTATGMCLSDVR